jgi:hypothetical protein
MTPRRRKALGAVAIVLFMLAYIWAAVTIAARLPDDRLVQMIYFIVAGIAWGLPLFPLITWIQRDR